MVICGKKEGVVMIKIKRFQAGLLRSSPQKRMEKFIEENNISRDQIVSITTDNTTLSGISVPAITLTYDE